MASTLLTSLENYWKFDETSGTSADDAVNNNDLTLVTGASFVSGGKSGYCVDFVSASSPTVTRPGFAGQNLSFAFWLNKDSLADRGGLFGHNDNSNRRVYLEIGADNKYLAGCGNTYSQEATASFSSAGSWVHIIVTMENTSAANYTMKVYQNNSEIISFSSVFSAGTSSDDFRIGAYSYIGSTVQNLDGKLDEFGIWTKVLTSGERAELYNSGDGFFYPFETPVTETLYSVLRGKKGEYSVNKNNKEYKVVKTEE